MAEQKNGPVNHDGADVKAAYFTPSIAQREQFRKGPEKPPDNPDLEFLRDLLNHADDSDHDTLVESIFAPDALDKLNRLESDHPGAYVTIREACQAHRIPIGKLEAAMAGPAKSVEHAQAEEAAKQRRQQFYAVPGGIDLPLAPGCAIPTGYSV